MAHGENTTDRIKVTDATTGQPLEVVGETGRKALGTNDRAVVDALAEIALRLDRIYELLLEAASK